MIVSAVTSTPVVTLVTPTAATSHWPLWKTPASRLAQVMPLPIYLISQSSFELDQHRQVGVSLDVTWLPRSSAASHF